MNIYVRRRRRVNEIRTTITVHRLYLYIYIPAAKPAVTSRGNRVVFRENDFALSHQDRAVHSETVAGRVYVQLS